MAWADGALPWLVALALVLGALTALVLWPLRFEVSGRARGLADGSWVVGGGMSLSVVSIALVWARGVSPQLSFLVFGHKLAFEPRLGARWSRPVPARVKAAWRRVEPLSLALKLL